jgi:hypothetical protein
LVLLPGGCVVTRLEPALDSLSGVAERLVSAVERRTDLSRLRLLVYEIHPMSRLDPRANRRHPAVVVHHEASQIGAVLEHEFVLHLSEHVNIVESEHSDRHQDSADEAGLKAAAKHHDANAVLAGDYIQIGKDVYVSVRVIDVDSMLVIGAARGVLRSGSLRRLGGDSQAEAAHTRRRLSSGGYARFR